MTNPLWRQTGGIWPLGVSCSLTWLDVGAIMHIIQVRHIRNIVEIGIEHGGLSAYLAAYCAVTGADYYGIDITLNPMDPRAQRVMGATFEQRDAWAPETVDRVRTWIAARPTPTLIICDGGDKPKELHLYAPLLRPGDVLIGHDYHNEYGDEAIADVPAKQLHADWLDDTLLCMFVAREDT